MLSLLLAASAGILTGQAMRPIPTEVEHLEGGWRLMRAGQPYFVKGAAGGHSLAELAAIGGNSTRTWGADRAEDTLEQAEKLGLTVTVGIWLGHKEQGFRYDDPKQVQAQFESAKQAVLKLRNYPALLMWGLGNEMEGYDGKVDPNVWNAVEQIAKMVKQLDPNHPTMTVVAEIGGEKLQAIQKYCPDIDVVGINSYGGSASIPERYLKTGIDKPYMLTEYGPVGWWESGKTPWGAPVEMTSTEKAAFYRNTYEKAVADHPKLCLGSYAFTWGRKQEGTATWFGMFLKDGAKLQVVDEMQQLWTGKPPANRCPKIHSLAVSGSPSAAPGSTISVSLSADDPDGDPLTVRWELVDETAKHGVGGTTEPTPEVHPEAIVAGSLNGATVRLPSTPGAYRLFAFVYDGKGAAATANLPLLAQTPTTASPKP